MEKVDASLMSVCKKYKHIQSQGPVCFAYHQHWKQRETASVAQSKGNQNLKISLPVCLIRRNKNKEFKLLLCILRRGYEDYLFG